MNEGHAADAALLTPHRRPPPPLPPSAAPLAPLRGENCRHLPTHRAPHDRLKGEFTPGSVPQPAPRRVRDAAGWETRRFRGEFPGGGRELRLYHAASFLLSSRPGGQENTPPGSACGHKHAGAFNAAVRTLLWTSVGR